MRVPLVTLAIIVAAGRGLRMGGRGPKAFLEVGGQSLLRRSARAFAEAPSVDAIVAVVPEDAIDSARAVLEDITKVKAIVPGGDRRQDSVLEGLKVAEGDDTIVLVHDAARPFVSVALIEAVVAEARTSGAALPVVPLADTVKRVGEGRVRETVDREELAAAQTPQGFRLSVLTKGYEQAFRERLTVTDEAMAVERAGLPVATVPGEVGNRKLTTPDDLLWAEAILAAKGGGA